MASFLRTSAFPLGLALVVALGMIRQGQPVNDDPYILYRYAQHLVDGTGWAFNPGAASANAVTSVLSVVVVAGFGRLGFHITAAATLMYFLTTWGAGLAVAAALGAVGLRRGGYFAAVLVAASPAFLSYWGMESSYVILLLAVTLYLGCSRRPFWWSTLTLGLMVLARPDSVLVGGLVVAACYLVEPGRRPDRREWARAVGAFAVPILAWSVYAWISLESVFPSTLEAKQAQATSGRWPVYFTATALRSVRESIGGPGVVGTGFVVVLLGLAAVAVLWSVRRRVAWQVTVPLALAIPLMAAAYGVVLGIASYQWYYATSVFALLVLAGIGLDRVVDRLGRTEELKVALSIGLCVALAAFGVSRALTGPSPARARYPYVGEWLRQHTPEDATVASIEIGELGWYSERDMVDYLGLLDPDVNDALADGDFSSWLATYQPDYWVTTGRWIDRVAFESRCVERYFTLVHEDLPLKVLERTAPIPRDEACTRPGSDAR